MEFCVITHVPDAENGESGNLASVFPLYRQVEVPSIENDYKGKVEHINDFSLLSLRSPVFTVGEILILGSDGREVGPIGRKPSKWDVGWETYKDLDVAVARAQEVMFVH